MKLILVLLLSLPNIQSAKLEFAGKVVDALGAELPGARVSVRNQSGFTVREALTTSQGEFRIEGLEPGIYLVSVDAEGLIQPGGAQEVKLDGSGKVGVRIRLELSAVRDSIVVSDTRTDSRAAESASSMYVVSASDLRRTQRPSVLDALRAAPGTNVVQSARRGGVTSLFVRGGESDYTKVLIDGVPVNDAGGAFDFSDLTTENADRIELVRGAQSTLYGSDAMTGVVQFFTRRGSTETPEIEISAEGGSFGFNRESISLSGAAGRFDYSSSFAYLATNGRDRNDDYTNRIASANLGMRIASQTQLRVTARSENSGLGAPGATAVYYPDPDERAERRRVITAVRFDDQTTSRWHQSISFVYAETDQKGFDPAGQDLTKPNTPPDTFFAFNDFSSFFSNHQRRRGLRYQSDIALPAANLLSLGLDFDQERAVFVNGFDGRDRVAPARRNIGFFIQNQFTLVPRLSIVLGMRVENNKAPGGTGFGTKVVPKIAASYVVSQGNAVFGSTRVHASYGTGIKAPTLIEAFSPSQFFLGNPALKSERSRSFDIGVDQLFFDERVRVEATWFDGRFRDQIAFVGNPATFGGPITLPDGRMTHFVNFDRATARGIELAAAYRPSRHFVVNGTFTLLDSEVTDAAPVIDFQTLTLKPNPELGLSLLRRPRHSGSLNAAWIGERFEANLAALIVGERRDIDPVSFSRLATNRGYSKVDLAGGWNVSRRTTLFARVENLLNRDYQEALGYPGYRLTFSAGIRARIGGEK